MTVLDGIKALREIFPDDIAINITASVWEHSPGDLSVRYSACAIRPFGGAYRAEGNTIGFAVNEVIQHKRDADAETQDADEAIAGLGGEHEDTCCCVECMDIARMDITKEG